MTVCKRYAARGACSLRAESRGVGGVARVDPWASDSGHCGRSGAGLPGQAHLCEMFLRVNGSAAQDRSGQEEKTSA